ncbi:MAG: hypothetical protein KTR18_17205 [Acidiferrobacterales bacterium]|nr:hypothetical protein [Acidiferrobacterales bacterium]
MSDWVEETNISLRPADKSALKKMICMQVPGFIEDNLASLMEQFINKVKQNERKACIEAISELDEPISGLINKQLTLNVCAYPHPEREENSATVQPAGELAQN